MQLLIQTESKEVITSKQWLLKQQTFITGIPESRLFSRELCNTPEVSECLVLFKRKVTASGGESSGIANTKPAGCEVNFFTKRL